MIEISMLVLIYYLKESRNVETNLYNKIKKEEQNLRQRLSEVKSVENRGTLSRKQKAQEATTGR